MASTRSYDFIVGPETSTKPTAGTPTLDNDIMTKGYADDTYAKLVYWGDAVADTTALKAVGSSDRSDMQARIKDDDKTIWVFDAGSSATEDGTTVIQPTSGTGRWLKASGSGGGSSGTASAAKLLQTQNELAGIGLTTRQLDNSLRASGLEVPAHTYITGYLIDNYSSGGSSITAVWNPVQVNASDKNMDATTNWTATGAGASLTTSATAKIGSASVRIDKNGTATEAGIRYDQGSQILSVGANYRVWFWVNLPSITNLSNVGIRMYADSTSNYRTWTKTTNYAGSALSTGWNLIFVDLSDTTGSTTGGTGWTYSALSRYQELFVTTSSAGQTYTAVLFDALSFSYGDIARFGTTGLEFTAQDTSNKRDFVIDAANTRHDGVLTLGATVAQAFTAGISNSDACFLRRSSLSWSQAGLIGYDSSLSSGTISTEQELRLVRTLRESLSGNYGAFVDMYTPQIYRITSVGGSTIGVDDSEDHSANLKNGNSVHIFRPYYNAGEIGFTLLATRAMTADSSASGGTTTLTLTTTSIAVGDYVVKQHLTVSASVVGASSNESYSAMSYDTSPNGAQLIGSRSYPNAGSVLAHWWLGASNETLALKDQSGRNSLTLTKVGSPNFSDTFKSGKYSVSGLNASNYLRTAGGSVTLVDGNSEQVQASIWIYYAGTDASARTIFSAYDETGASSDGWYCQVTGGAATITLTLPNAGAGNTLVSGNAMSVGWNHLVVQIEGGTTEKLYLNGVLSSTTATSCPAGSTQAFYIGAQSLSTTVDASVGTGATAIRLADLILWRGGSLLSQSDVNYLYNGGVPQFFGYNPAVLRNEYSVTGQSGQKISMKAKLNRTTTAITPYILNAGMIKTG